MEPDVFETTEDEQDDDEVPQAFGLSDVQVKRIRFTLPSTGTGFPPTLREFLDDERRSQ